jgi:hypothetical protein
MRDVRAAMRSDDPLDLLAHVSTMLSVCDPRLENPFEPRDAAAGAPDLEELVTSFVEVVRPETTALLAVLAALLPPEGPAAWVEAHRRGRPAGRPLRPATVPGLGELDGRALRRAVAERSHRMPDWLRRLDEVEVTTATEMVHVLGDGDNVIVGLRIPPHHELSVVAYIDHNLGRVAKDAFVVPAPVDQLVADMKRMADDPDTEWRDARLADARARIADAVEHGAMTWPPFETDTWPACRPLVEWMLRLMPSGGSAGEPREWTDDETSRLIDAFLSSPDGARHRSRAGREMVDALVWYGTGYGKCDPLRWSPVSVEIVLTDWVPRKIVAPVKDLRLVPDVLRDLVRYGHRELGIRQDLTDDTLEAVDTFSRAYLALIRSPRPQGVDAIMSAVRDAGGSDDPDVDAYADLAGEHGGDLDAEVAEIMLDSLAREVGGADVLRAMQDDPLPDEPFEAGTAPGDIRDRVDEVAALCDGWFAALGDDERGVVELRTATRRLLAHIADTAPEVLRRRAKVEGTAAALCWAVASANRVFDGRPGSPRAGDLSAHFGVSGSPASRARTMLRAAGLAEHTDVGPVVLPPAMLTSAHRASVMESRDRWLGDL